MFVSIEPVSTASGIFSQDITTETGYGIGAVKDLEDICSSDGQATRADSDTDLTSSSVSLPSEECSSSPRMAESPLAENCKLPVPCAYYAKGNCTKGQSCRFSHGKLEIRRAVRQAGNHRHRVAKTQLCTFFEHSRCLSGAHCFFAHGEEELRQARNAQGALRTTGLDEPQIEIRDLSKEPCHDDVHSKTREGKNMYPDTGGKEDADEKSGRVHPAFSKEQEDHFASMASAKVHRWDGELGRWVVEVLDIEEYVPVPHQVSLSRALNCTKLAAVKKPKAVLGQRTPLQGSAALFVPSYKRSPGYDDWWKSTLWY
jgi:hypothetical protein